MHPQKVMCWLLAPSVQPSPTFAPMQSLVKQASPRHGEEGLDDVSMVFGEKRNPSRDPWFRVDDKSWAGWTLTDVSWLFISTNVEDHVRFGNLNPSWVKVWMCDRTGCIGQNTEKPSVDSGLINIDYRDLERDPSDFFVQRSPSIASLRISSGELVRTRVVFIGHCCIHKQCCDKKSDRIPAQYW